MTEEHGIELSDNETDEDQYLPRAPLELEATLCKWTNYIHGWQDRYIILKDGKLSYYKNKSDSAYGCRGSLNVEKAIVKPHEIDECRFDVCLNDSVWYLRTCNADEKHQWVDAIDHHKEIRNLRRHGSSVSLTLSVTSSSSFKRIKGIKEKLEEIDTYRDIVVKQMETLQIYFDDCAKLSKTGMCNGGLTHESEFDKDGSSPKPHYIPSEADVEKHCKMAIDFKGEALTFKATTAGIVQALTQCQELMGQREEFFKKRHDKDIEKCKKMEERIKNVNDSPSKESQTKYVVVGSPDYEEGPHSVIAEDDFFDAVDTALDRFDKEEEFRQRLRLKMQNAPPPQPTCQHQLWPEIEKVTKEQLNYAQSGVEDGVWQIFAEDGEMKMYRRELEEDGLVVDPLKAVHQVSGVTAHELVHYFWSPDVRFEWDTTLEQMTVLDNVSEDTLIFLQVHKRVWPTAQRDSLFWSHICKIPQSDAANKDAYDTWIVCNKSTEHVEAPNDGKYIRLDLIVCFVCQTFVDPVTFPQEQITRDNLRCKITYCSIVNPGGWAPASILRAVYKREYPKFLKRFTKYVIDKCRNQPPAFSGLKIPNYSKHWRN